MSLARRRLSKYQKTLQKLKATAEKTQTFKDFLAVLNFIHNKSFIQTQVGKVKVHVKKEN